MRAKGSKEIKRQEASLKVDQARRRAIASGSVKGESADQMLQRSTGVALKNLIQRGSKGRDTAQTAKGGKVFEMMVSQLEGLNSVEMMRKAIEDPKYAKQLKKKYDMDLAHTKARRSLEKDKYGQSHIHERQEGAFF